MKNQEKLTKGMLKYLSQRIDEGYTDIPFIKSEVKGAESIEDYQLAEALKQSLIILEGEKEKKGFEPLLYANRMQIKGLQTFYSLKPYLTK